MTLQHIDPVPIAAVVTSDSNFLERTGQILLYSIPLFAFIAFSSLSAYWVVAPYDGWRIYELLILIGFSGYLICSKNTHSSLFSPKTNKIISFLLIILAGLVACSSYYAQYSQRAIADAGLYFLLASFVYTQAILLRKNPKAGLQIAAWLAILPMLTLIFLPLAIYDRLHGFDGTWSQSFANIRMLDDALLPCLFLLWQRPAWLSKNMNKTKIFNRLLSSLVYVMSIIYILSFLLHGARASLLAITISLGLIIALTNKKQWYNLLLPLISSGIAALCFFVLSQAQVSAKDGSTLVRMGSSERVEIWQKSIQLWQEHTILGTGGNSFLLNPPYMKQGHPHNIFLQFLSEWGISAILVVILLIPLVIHIFRKQNILPSFVLGAIVALGINMMLSGALIYPVSQLLALWPLAWAISILPVYKYKTVSQYTTVYKQPSILFPYIFKLIAFIALISILVTHGRDIVCNNCISLDWEGAPRFWDAGRAMHLESKKHN